MTSRIPSRRPVAGGNSRAVAVPRAARHVAAERIAAWFLMAATALALLLLATAAQAKDRPDSFADLAERLLPAVVNISSTQMVGGPSTPDLPQLPPGSPFEEFFKEFFDKNHPQQEHKATSLGSGFIIRSDGYVVTNNHVIQDSEEITVILQDDTRLKAELVGHDPKTDLAVLKVKPAKPLPSVQFGDSENLRVGDWVLAIGNPFGLGGTVTAGIISARGRDINTGPYDDFLQTDASINRGNSGGPMFDLDGKVVGINTAIFSPSGGSIGIGFAIPSAMAAPVVNQLIETGTVKRGWLGVLIQTVTDEIAETLGLKKAEGALVASVIDNGPAKEADIEAGDVILEFDGKPVTSMRHLPRIVAETGVGKTVDVVIWRNNAKKTVRVKVGELSAGEDQVASVAPDQGDTAAEEHVDALGLTLSVITDSLREKFNLGADAKGVVVTGVDAGGPASEKGIQPGDMVVEVSQEDVKSPSQVMDLVKSARSAGRKSVLMLLQGQGRLRFEAVRLSEG